MPVVSCPVCHMRTEMPEKHMEKYKEVHKMLGEGVALIDALRLRNLQLGVEQPVKLVEAGSQRKVKR